MVKVVQEITTLLSRVLELTGFRGSIIFVFDVDSDAKSIKLKSRLFPILDI